jgi:hypothetical protein
VVGHEGDVVLGDDAKTALPEGAAIDRSPDHIYRSP